MPITPIEVPNILGSYVQGLELGRQARAQRAKEAQALELRNMLAAATPEQLEDPRFINQLIVRPGGAEIAKPLAESLTARQGMRKNELEIMKLEVERLAGEAGSFLQAYQDNPASLNKASVAPWLNSAVRRGLMNPEDLQTFEAMPDDPAQLAARLQQLQAQGMSVADQLRYTTPTAGERLTAETTIRGQNIGAETTRRGQDITAETTRRGQDISAEVSRRGQDISAYIQGPEHQASVTTARKRAESDVKFVDEFNSAKTTAQRTLSLIDQMLGDATVQNNKVVVPQLGGKPGKRPMAGFEQAVGASIIPGARFVPGSSARNFNAYHDQAVGTAFMQAFETLKGGGQITEKEGEKATAALNRMNLAVDEKEYIKAAREFQTEVKSLLNLAETRYNKIRPGGTSVTGGTPSIDALLEKYK
jgi:hypothetical protein